MATMAALGRFGFPITSAYASTKFAIEGLSESMAYELEPFGIKMVLVEPGFIKGYTHLSPFPLRFGVTL